jgi:nicotinamide-nucleotide amidase
MSGPIAPDLAVAVLDACRRAGVMLATAESCTGGLIAAALTDIGGSSDVVERGFVTYSNDAKSEMLGVPAALIAANGAVSREVALAMVAGAIAHSRAGIAVAVTGIAGPGGGTAGKPVGLVHIAAQRAGHSALHRERHFGDIGRAEVRHATMLAALDLVIEVLD